jgi:hypothetical protein
MSQNQDKIVLLDGHPNEIDPILVERYFHDWISNNKSLYRLAKDHNVTETLMEKLARKYKWDKRKERVLNRVHLKHEEAIIKAKSEILETSIKIIKIATKKVKKLIKQEEDGVIKYDTLGRPVLVDPFIKNPKDWKTVIESFYLALNDGVDRKQVDHTSKIELTDSKAEKMLELLAKDESTIIDGECEDVKEAVEQTPV